MQQSLEVGCNGRALLHKHAASCMQHLGAQRAAPAALSEEGCLRANLHMGEGHTTVFGEESMRSADGCQPFTVHLGLSWIGHSFSDTMCSMLAAHIFPDGHACCNWAPLADCCKAARRGKQLLMAVQSSYSVCIDTIHSVLFDTHQYSEY